MADATGLVEKIKQAAVEAQEAGKPVNVFFGEVTGISPLKINVEQKMVLGEEQLVLTRNVTDFDTMVTMNWETEEEKQTHFHSISGQTDSGGNTLTGKTEKQSARHSHVMKGKKQITIHNGLDVGDQVVLIRQQEGQKYFVLDRIGAR